MKVQGVIVEWNDARCFGFIEPQRGGKRVFFHVKVFKSYGFGSQGRSQIGQMVTCTFEQDPKGRAQAIKVLPIGGFGGFGDELKKGGGRSLGWWPETMSLRCYTFVCLALPGLGRRLCLLAGLFCVDIISCYNGTDYFDRVFF